jgi:hypothetical protein
VELVVVIGIMAVLVAQSMATFLGLREAADHRRVESNVRNAFAAARVYYSVEVAYTSDPLAMETVEPAFTWNDAPLDDSADRKAIYVAAHDSGQTLVLAGRSEQRCFFLRDEPNGPITGSYYAYDASGPCLEPDPSLYGPSWTD